MFFCPGTASHADNGRSVAIKQAQVPIRATEIKGSINLAGETELPFHFRDNLQRANPSSSGGLGQIHAKVIMAGRRVVFAGNQLFASGDALVGNFTPLRAVGSK